MGGVGWGWGGGGGGGGVTNDIGSGLSYFI